MGLPSLLAVALALAMDAFAVAVVSGIALDPLTRRQVFRLAFHFGLFQALMPGLGWAVGASVHHHIAEWDHWIAMGLLGLVGGKMVLGAFRKGEERRMANDPTTGWSLVFLSVATSVDAFAVGLSLAMIGSDILVPALVIGIVAASLTAVGMALGRRLGLLWGKRAELLGGLVLVGIGVTIVLEHVLVA
jgi:manganese efflux pump family protein